MNFTINRLTDAFVTSLSKRAICVVSARAEEGVGGGTYIAFVCSGYTVQVFWAESTGIAFRSTVLLTGDALHALVGWGAVLIHRAFSVALLRRIGRVRGDTYSFGSQALAATAIGVFRAFHIRALACDGRTKIGIADSAAAITRRTAGLYTTLQASFTRRTIDTLAVWSAALIGCTNLAGLCL